MNLMYIQRKKKKKKLNWYKEEKEIIYKTNIQKMAKAEYC